MTAQATSWLRAGLDRVANDEIAAVNLARLDPLRPACLDRQLLSEVVAGLAVRLGVTALAERPLLRDLAAMVAQKGGVVTQKAQRQSARKVACCMARAAFRALPLLGVLMALKALAHARQRGALFADDPGVTRNALAPKPVEREVLLVVEADLAARPGRFEGQDRADAVAVVAVARFAQTPLGQGVAAAELLCRVAARTLEASRILGAPASDLSQVELVREASCDATAPASRERERDCDGGQQHQRGPLRPDALLAHRTSAREASKS
jgi:hypothetical protein